MQITTTITRARGRGDASQLVQTTTWSGDYKQCARTLDFGLLSSPTDQHIPIVPCPNGSGVVLTEDGLTRFSGFIVSRTKSTESSIIDLSCYDRGFFVKKNEASYKFVNMTPEAIARRVCADFNIKLGNVAETGVKVSRIFIAKNLYQIIQTAYTLASAVTKEQYQMRFEDDSLCVVKKGVNSETVIIRGGKNLISASTTESILDMVNQVQIVDSAGKVIKTVADSVAVATYGLMQKQLKQATGRDMLAEANKLLADSGENQRITLNNLGDVRCVTGNAVIVQEPYTGLYGLFYIDSDVHTWKNGLYFNKLVVNFKRIMDEQEVGDLIS
jgi:hypothetical protein